MPELVIKYRNKQTPEVLMDFAKYFGFSVLMPKKTVKNNSINGVTIVPADNSIDTSDLEAIFSNKNIDAKQLRKNAWQRSL